MGDVEPIRLFSTDTLIDPYDTYRTLRDTAPVYYVPEMNIHVITRYDLLREAIRDTKRFSSKFDQFMAQTQRILFDNAAPDIQAELIRLNDAMIPLPPTMLTLDEPEHTRYRSLVNQLFTVSQIKGAEASVQKVINDTIARFGDREAIDFATDFAFPVPLAIISDRLGIPLDDRPFFNRAAASAASALRLTPLTGEQMVERAQLALDLQKLLVRLVELRRSEPADDMISILANSKLEQEDRYLTHGECISILNQFLVAGHETTTSAFGFGMLILCRNPSLQDEIRNDPKLVKTFVEETLRIEAPVQGLPRLVTEDTELGGYPLKAGELVMLRYGAANRDERQFPEPDEVNIHRKKAGTQMAFGAGVHFCIGAPLARQELNLGFPALLNHGENFRLDPDHPAPLAEPSVILRNLPHLHINFTRR